VTWRIKGERAQNAALAGVALNKHARSAASLPPGAAAYA
jgi:hypothetical protein